MRLEHVLAVASGTHDGFLSSQRSELDQLERLQELLAGKASYISGKHPQISVEPVVSALSHLIAANRELNAPVDNISARLVNERDRTSAVLPE